MKKISLLLFIIMVAGSIHAQDNMLLETKHFRFYSNPILNLHLYLYQHAVKIKTAKVPDDSLHHYLKSQGIDDISKMRPVMIPILKFYRDSITTRDMLFDSTMRKFSVLLATGKLSEATGWQVEALRYFQQLFPFFEKQVWPGIHTTNKNWVSEVSGTLSTHEENVINRLQKIYGDSLPKEKIRIDLGIYATWAGAYSYMQGIDHIIISTYENANKGNLGVEIVFHEASHFMIDEVMNFITEYSKSKNVVVNRGQTWHIVLFYTTGIVFKESLASKGIGYTPYYKHARFEERTPPFKLTTEALTLYWDTYMRGETSKEEALQKVIDYMLTNTGK